jgi:hypothetical protein
MHTNALGIVIIVLGVVSFFLLFPRTRKRTLEALKPFLTIFILFSVVGIIVFGMSEFSYAFFPESPWAYAMKYDTESENVVIDKKPHDCEWETSVVTPKPAICGRVKTGH